MQIRAWREQINAQVRVDAGFAYEGYIRLKLASVRAFVASLIAGIRGAPPLSQFGRTIAEIIDVWATETGVVYGKDLAIAEQRHRPSAAIRAGPNCCSISMSTTASGACIS